jgi:hypothetical protein
MKNIKELGLELIHLEDQILLIDRSTPFEKTIASTKQLNNIPLLVIEDEVDLIAKEIISSEVSKEAFESDNFMIPVYEEFVKEVYNKAKSTYKFTEDDIIDFAEWKDHNFYQHIEDNLYRTMQVRPMYKKLLENKSYTIKELLQIFKEQIPNKEMYIEIDIMNKGYTDKSDYPYQECYIPKINNNKIHAVWK